MSFICKLSVKYVIFSDLIYLTYLIKLKHLRLDNKFQKDNFYSSETAIEKFNTVNVIRGNDLRYDGCRGFKKDLTAPFQQKDENSFRNCHRSSFLSLKNSKHPGEKFKGK